MATTMQEAMIAAGIAGPDYEPTDVDREHTARAERFRQQLAGRFSSHPVRTLDDLRRLIAWANEACVVLEDVADDWMDALDPIEGGGSGD